MDNSAQMFATTIHSRFSWRLTNNFTNCCVSSKMKQLCDISLISPRLPLFTTENNIIANRKKSIFKNLDYGLPNFLMYFLHRHGTFNINKVSIVLRRFYNVGIISSWLSRHRYCKEIRSFEYLEVGILFYPIRGISVHASFILLTVCFLPSLYRACLRFVASFSSGSFTTLFLAAK